MFTFYQGIRACIKYIGIVQGRALIPPDLTELPFNFPKRALAPRWRWADRQERCYNENYNVREYKQLWTEDRLMTAVHANPVIA